MDPNIQTNEHNALIRAVVRDILAEAVSLSARVSDLGNGYFNPLVAYPVLVSLQQCRAILQVNRQLIAAAIVHREHGTSPAKDEAKPESPAASPSPTPTPGTITQPEWGFRDLANGTAEVLKAIDSMAWVLDASEMNPSHRAALRDQLAGLYDTARVAALCTTAYYSSPDTKLNQLPPSVT